MRLIDDTHQLITSQRVGGCLALSLLLHLMLFQIPPGGVFLHKHLREPKTESRLNARLIRENGGSQQIHDQASASRIDKETETKHHSTAPTDGATDPSQQSSPLPPSHLGLFDGPWYYSARYLHRRPEPLQAIRPTYPVVSDQQVRTIRVLLFISKEGNVDTFRLMNAESDDPYASSVIKAFIHARFTPGIIADMPVKSQLLAEVYFDPGNPAKVDLTLTPMSVDIKP